MVMVRDRYLLPGSTAVHTAGISSPVTSTAVTSKLVFGPYLATMTWRTSRLRVRLRQSYHVAKINVSDEKQNVHLQWRRREGEKGIGRVRMPEISYGNYTYKTRRYVYVGRACNEQIGDAEKRRQRKRRNRDRSRDFIRIYTH